MGISRENINPERVELLCRALESGEYEKGEHALHVRTPDGKHKWCCLGVAGDVAHRNGLAVTREMFGDIGDFLLESIGGDSTVMSPQVRKWYGFGSCSPRVLIPGRRGDAVKAAHLNDNGYWDGETMRQITLPEIGAAFRRTYLEDHDG